MHSDGTFIQHTVAKNGEVIETANQRWEYLGDESISLDKRRDWDSHVDPVLGGASHVNGAINGAGGTVEGQVLIVKFDSPPTILINPDSDCVYVKTK